VAVVVALMVEQHLGLAVLVEAVMAQTEAPPEIPEMQIEALEAVAVAAVALLAALVVQAL
jgi:hypothetical protein